MNEEDRKMVERVMTSTVVALCVTVCYVALVVSLTGCEAPDQIPTESETPLPTKPEMYHLEFIVHGGGDIDAGFQEVRKLYASYGVGLRASYKAAPYAPSSLGYADDPFRQAEIMCADFKTDPDSICVLYDSSDTSGDINLSGCTLPVYMGVRLPAVPYVLGWTLAHELGHHRCLPHNETDDPGFTVMREFTVDGFDYTLTEWFDMDW